MTVSAISNVRHVTILSIIRCVFFKKKKSKGNLRYDLLDLVSNSYKLWLPYSYLQYFKSKASSKVVIGMHSSSFPFFKLFPYKPHIYDFLWPMFVLCNHIIISVLKLCHRFLWRHFFLSNKVDCFLRSCASARLNFKVDK